MKLDRWGFSALDYMHPALDETSDNYLYTPSRLAQNAFLYPLNIGHYLYHRDFYIQRDSYDSFLLLYVQEGSLYFEVDGKTSVARTGDFVLLDCYAPHAYYTKENCENYWLHFDGHSARTYYQLIVSRHGMIFSLPDSYAAISLLVKLYQIFSGHQTINEILLSKYICDLLSEILLQKPANSGSSQAFSSIDSSISYISAHLGEELSVEQLAEKASMSVYHFIRVFKKQTEMTPHKYITNARIHRAKFLLKHSAHPTKEICFACGFSDPASFSACFKKHTGMSPSQYRNTGGTILTGQRPPD